MIYNQIFLIFIKFFTLNKYHKVTIISKKTLYINYFNTLLLRTLSISPAFPLKIISAAGSCTVAVLFIIAKRPPACFVIPGIDAAGYT